MALRTGIVTNIYRGGHESINPGSPDTPCVHLTALEAAFGGLTLEERSRLSNLPATFDGTPPPPLSVVTFDTANHELRVVGVTRGRIQTLLHEHFLSWIGASATADAGTYDWRITGSGTGELTNAAGITDSYGSIILGTRNASGATTGIAKYGLTVNQPAGTVLWLHARQMIDEPLSYIQVHCGLTNSLASMSTRAGFVVNNNSASTTPSLQAECAVGGVTSSLTLPGVVEGSANGGQPPVHWYDYDVVLDAAQNFCAFWWEGDGPYVITTNVSSQQLTPYMRVRTYNTARKAAYWDSISLTVLGEVDVRHPQLDPALAMMID